MAASKKAKYQFKTKRPPLVRVVWRDSHRIIEWEGQETMRGEVQNTDLTIETIGYLVTETEDRIALSLNWSDTLFGMVMVIPKFAITERDEVKI